MILSAAVYWQARLPDEYALTRGGSLRLPGNITAVYGEETAVARSGEATAEAQLRLPLGVSVKTVSVRYVQRDTVLVSGRPFGIKMFTEGLMVVGFRRWQAHQSGPQRRPCHRGYPAESGRHHIDLQ